MVDHPQAWAWVEGRLAPERLEHTRGVYAAARELAGLYHEDMEKTGLAAILHDGAKNLGGPALLSLARREGIIVDIVQQQAPDLLHGPMAAVLARNELGVDDPEVLQAISLHTTGAPHMTRLDKVVYLADYIEPGRRFQGVENLRELARRDLDQAVLGAMNGTLRYVIEQGWLIHPLTVEARNWLLSQI